MLTLQAPRLRKDDMVRVPKWAVSAYMTSIVIMLVVTLAALALVLLER